MPKYEITIIETIEAGSIMETKLEIEADTVAEAIAKAKPSWQSKYGRTYSVKQLTSV